jgi:hypothetical protein
MSCIANRFWAGKSVKLTVLAVGLALLSQWTAVAVQNVEISWNPRADASVTGYKIYYGSSSRAYSSTLNAGSVTNLTITGLADGSTNFFAATTYDSAGNESSFSSEVSFVAGVSNPNVITNPPGVLNTVANVSVATNMADAHSVLVSWDASADAGVTGYHICWGTNSGNYTKRLDVGQVTSLVVTGLVEGSTNFFAVRSVDGDFNESPMSSEAVWFLPVAGISIPDPIIVTNPPAGLSIVANVAVATNLEDAHSVLVSWDASADAGVTGYHICWGTNSGNYTKRLDVGQVTSLVVTGLVEGSTNFFAVRSVDGAFNESPMSSEAAWFLPAAENLPPTLNPLANVSLNLNAVAQTIVLTGISSGSIGDGQTVKITAAANNSKLISNLSVKYSNPNAAGTLTFKPVANATGTAIITVTAKDSGAGSNTVTQTFMVTVVNQVLMAALPRIVRQLTNSATLPGKNVTLGVAVSGRAPFKYQWKHDGTNMAGATGATLTLKAVKAAQAGRYSVQVSNSVGVTNSTTASVTIITNTAPAISTVAKINGQFAFQVGGVSGAKYVVQGSTDLKNWTSLQTNTAPFTFADANTASFNQRYYRAYYQP